ncbi:MAG: tetratricopeptide repeat protein [Saprospiraceae bacterium]|jgi:tetratricopeptide (TPR) repeat protein|nr:tetratricopeptide repeat protein [Saprospiraceae bacterium]MBK8885743.1 tetratricopeptide repeat protein [Saprospiraceae bacterium]MBK9741659.1 tetratricopeptide repeat protein [Saprospiraceae bacterium]HMT51916.1 tetratricopeptide repeat protein [Saprospiraceae bacterium]HQV65218.1 tetratricopeptide repeat protein [Saprospiraceae bacterium]
MSQTWLRKLFLLTCLTIITLAAFGQQKYKLANEYYNSGEYEKAAQLYESLYKESPGNKSYFNLYIQCLLDLKDYNNAKDIIESEIKKNPSDVSLYVTNGNLLERLGFPDKANDEYKKAINNLNPDPSNITNLASTFTNLAKYDFAIETYKKGEKLSNVENLYVYNLADLYRRQGDTKNMIRCYLISVEKEANSFNTQTSLQRFLTEDDYTELQKQLYQKIQEKPDIPHFGELLQWTFIQKKEYDKALRQAKALDRQFEENGARVYTLAELIYNDKDYNNAIDAYSYIVTNQGRNTSFYLDAKRGLLNSKKAKVTQNFNYTKEDLFALKAEYKSFLDEMGRNTQTAPLMQEFADFEALYVNELDTAIMILEELRQFGGLHPESIAKAKLSLGDYYLMNGDRWEASLLFSQVDKDFKEGQTGENARYRNAKLSYYAGDFEWAQEQFKILKGATSKLISNDAIDMSVFILDNLGMDTTEVTLQMFAQADLLAFQNKYAEAIAKLDSIKILFPEHSLDDDVLYTKAQIYRKLRKTDEMISMYNTIIEKFPTEIKADNAIYELAELYETKLNEPEKAKVLYEKIFTDYSASTFAFEARQRYRKLRGDEL